MCDAVTAGFQGALVVHIVERIRRPFGRLVRKPAEAACVRRAGSARRAGFARRAATARERGGSIRRAAAAGQRAGDRAGTPSAGSCDSGVAAASLRLAPQSAELALLTLRLAYGRPARART